MQVGLITHYHPKSSIVDHSGNLLSDEDAELIKLLGLADRNNVVDDYDTQLLKSLPKGLDYKWCQPPLLVSGERL